MATDILRSARASPLRWAGGKQWLAPFLSPLLDTISASHLEPFVGGGSIFFGRTQLQSAVLNDGNSDLINCLRAIRDDPMGVAYELQKWAPDEKTYYAIRLMEPNNDREAAARFLFLNRTSYGGLWRVNRAGKYNVPYGRLSSPWIPTEQHLSTFGEQLALASLTASDFRESLSNCPNDAVVYCDPPYAVGSESTAGFNRYTPYPFSYNDHIDLARAVAQAASRGSWVFVSLPSLHLVGLYPTDHFDVFTRLTRMDLVSPTGGMKHRREYLLTPRALQISPPRRWIRLPERAQSL